MKIESLERIKVIELEALCKSVLVSRFTHPHS